LCAFSAATSDALTKRFFGRLSAYEMAVIRLSYTFVWLSGAAFFVPWTNPGRDFWMIVAVALPLEMLAYSLYIRAIKISPLSLTLPFLAYTPIFVILTGWTVLGEKISLIGLSGIFLIVAGSYLLNFSRIGAGILEPFAAILKEPGSRLMLIVSVIYSLTATLGKSAIIHSNPYFMGVVYNMMLAALMMCLFPFHPGASFRNIAAKPFHGLALGAVASATIFTHMVAVSQVQVAYMISLKRTSLLIGVLYGAFLFREENIGERLIGAGVMLMGVLLIGFYA